MSKRNVALLLCGLSLVLLAGNVSVRRYQHHQTEQKTLEIDLGYHSMDRQPRPKPDEESIAAAQRLAKELVSHPKKETFIITWSKGSDEFSYQVIVTYNRPAHGLAISRKETSIYMTEDSKVTTLIHEFAQVTDDRITALATKYQPLQNLVSYNCTRVGGQGEPAL
jgi:hypothetical protein